MDSADTPELDLEDELSDAGDSFADDGVVPDESLRSPRDEVRQAALAAYHASLRSPDRHSDDPVVKAKMLVAIDDAREAYRAAGGSPGSQWSVAHRAAYLDARELLGEDVTERRVALELELAEARDEFASKRRR